jgi:hypothetical protein
MSLVPSLENLAWCEEQKKKYEERVREGEELKKQFHPVPELLGYTTSEQLAEWVASCELRWSTISQYPWETQQHMYREKERHEPIVAKCKKYLQDHPADVIKVKSPEPPLPATNPNGGQFVLSVSHNNQYNPTQQVAQPTLLQTLANQQVVPENHEREQKLQLIRNSLNYGHPFLMRPENLRNLSDQQLDNLIRAQEIKRQREIETEAKRRLEREKFEAAVQAAMNELR